MNETAQNPGGPSSQPGWNRARPDVIPEPTAWPASLALSVTLSLWGLASSLIITAVGVGLFVLSLAGWIGEIRHERNTH